MRYCAKPDTIRNHFLVPSPLLPCRRYLTLSLSWVRLGCPAGKLILTVADDKSFTSRPTTRDKVPTTRTQGRGSSNAKGKTVGYSSREHPPLSIYIQWQKDSNMVLERLQQMASHLTGQVTQGHPLDPLTTEEIQVAVTIVKREYPALHFNAVTLWEPRKLEMQAWLSAPETVPRPHRVADIVAIGRGSKVFDGLVDLNEGRIVKWELTEGVQPLITSTYTYIRETWSMPRSIRGSFGP